MGLNDEHQKRNGTFRDQLLTIGDLQKFRDELLDDLKLLLAGSMQLQPKQWLRSAEVRKMLGISSGTLQNFRVNGTLPHTKIGGIVFYRYDDIVKLLELNSSKPSRRG